MSRAAVAWTVGAVVVAGSVLVVTDTGPDLFLVATIIVAGGTTVSVVRGIADRSTRPTLPPAPTEPPPPAPPDLRAGVLRQALGDGGSQAHHAERLRDQLAAIVDDQLMTVHGVDRATEPERAHRLLGAELTEFLGAPIGRLNPRRLDRLLARVEAL